MCRYLVSYTALLSIGPLPQSRTHTMCTKRCRCPRTTQTPLYVYSVRERTQAASLLARHDTGGVEVRGDGLHRDKVDPLAGRQFVRVAFLANHVLWRYHARGGERDKKQKKRGGGGEGEYVRLEIFLFLARKINRGGVVSLGDARQALTSSGQPSCTSPCKMPHAVHVLASGRATFQS